MTENENSPENLRKFLESDDPAMVQMGLSMAKGSGLTEDVLPTILGLCNQWENMNSHSQNLISNLVLDVLNHEKDIDWQTFGQWNDSMTNKILFSPIPKENFEKTFTTLLKREQNKIPTLLKEFEKIKVSNKIKYDNTQRKLAEERYIDAIFGAKASIETRENFRKRIRNGEMTLSEIKIILALPLIKSQKKTQKETAAERKKTSLWIINDLIMFLPDIFDSETSENKCFRCGIDLEFTVAERAVHFLEPRCSECVIKVLQNKDKDIYVRTDSVSALGKIGDEISVEALTKALKDKDQDVRNAAKEALKKLGHEVE